MTPLRDALLNAYYLATLPRRRRAAADRADRGTEPVSRALLPPRGRLVAEWLDDADPHLRPADSLAAGAVRRREPRRSSGADRLRPQHAADRLRSRSTTATPKTANSRCRCCCGSKLPFTYFVSTNHVFANRPFPHDVAAGRPLAPNSLSQLRELAAAGVEIGAHNRNHVHLGVALADVIEDEIVGSKHDLEQALQREVRYYAFPYGQPSDLSTTAFQIAYHAGYRGVCSAYGGYNFPGDDPFHLRRIHADCELVRLKNWLTVDPRKLRHPIEFDPGDFRATVAAAGRTSTRRCLASSARHLMSDRCCQFDSTSQRAPARARFAGRQRDRAAGGERRAAERRLRPGDPVLPLALARRARPVGHGLQLPAAGGASHRAGPARFVRPLPRTIPPTATAADVPAAHCHLDRGADWRPRSASSSIGRRVFPGSCSAGRTARRW